MTLGLRSWCAPSQALALVTSPRLGLQQKNTLEAIKGSLLNDYDVQNANQYEQLVEYVSNLKKHYGFPRDVEDFGSNDVSNDDSNEFEFPSNL